MIAISGPSGSGKTRLVSRLLPALAARGLRVAYLKHTGHVHPFDVPGKDTEVARRAGAVAALIEGPEGLALFGPPRGRISALLDLLPPADLVVAEGWKREPLDKIEVHRRSVSREFLCARDRRVIAVVSDVEPPRPIPRLDPDDVEAIADLVVAWRAGHARRGRTRARRARRTG